MTGPRSAGRVISRTVAFRAPATSATEAFPMIDEILSELRVSLEKAHAALKRDLAKLRTGRAHSSMLEGIRVDYYGTPTPLAQMATVNVPEPRLITVKPWDKSQVKAVEKAIKESDIGFN